MSLPLQLLTTTCDIYRGNPPPGGATPAATNVPCQLVPDYAHGALVPANSARGWTHYLVLDTTVDLRDSFPGMNIPWAFGNTDTVHIPSGSSTAYAVVFVELSGKGGANEHKLAYLDRLLPNWPTL